MQPSAIFDKFRRYVRYALDLLPNMQYNQVQSFINFDNMFAMRWIYYQACDTIKCNVLQISTLGLLHIWIYYQTTQNNKVYKQTFKANNVALWQRCALGICYRLHGMLGIFLKNYRALQTKGMHRLYDFNGVSTNDTTIVMHNVCRGHRPTAIASQIPHLYSIRQRYSMSYTRAFWNWLGQASLSVTYNVRCEGNKQCQREGSKTATMYDVIKLCRGCCYRPVHMVQR